MSTVIYRRLFNRALLLLLAAAVAACSIFPEAVPRYKRDGAPNQTLSVCSIENAIPQVEPIGARGNPDKYTVKGRTYKVLRDVKGYRERGDASWYGTAFHGNPTSSGERYDMYQMTAAHKHLPLPSYVEVRNLDNQRRVIVRVNDRGPFINGRIIDLSYAAATKLGILARGTARVEIAVIDPANFDYAAWVGDHDCKVNRPAADSSSYPVVASTPVAPSVALPATASVQTTTRSNRTGDVEQASDPDRIFDTAESSEAEKPLAARADTVYIQLATYSQLATAEAEQKRLSKFLLASDIHYAVGLYPYFLDSQSLPWYRLRLGPIESGAAANQLMQNAIFQRFGKIYTVSGE